MRIAAAATLLFALASCSTTNTDTVSPYQQPNQLMGNEINQRIEQIPYQHREELVQNLLWLAQTGEQTIPALLQGLNSDNPKVRSSCCWVLGRLRDRRTVPSLQRLTSDSETSVRMEASRSLVLMGDIEQAPKLIEGLDSDRKEVRYMCHEALKSATGHDFGYDHLNQNQQELQVAVLRWRQWWGEYSGDQFFAQSYEQQHNLNNLAAPGGETRPMQDAGPKPEGNPGNGNASNGTQPEAVQPQSGQPQSGQPQSGQPQSGQPGGGQPQNEQPNSSQSNGAAAGEPQSGTTPEQPSPTPTGTSGKPATTPVIQPPVVDAPKPGANGSQNAGSQKAGSTGATGTGSDN
ncbi:MAG: HEAT repeat domain-containing protein [Planctomycetota bacterium]